MSGYRGPGILRRHAIDNSCGDGAFLDEMVRRYSAEAVKAGYSGAELARDLGTYIHGRPRGSRRPPAGTAPPACGGTSGAGTR